SRRHGWGLNLFRHDCYQSRTLVGRNQVFGFLITLTLQKTDANQLLNDTGTGRRRSQTFALHLIRHFVRSGSFHSRKQRILGKVVDRKSTRLNSSHVSTSYAGLCLKKKKKSKWL